MNKLSKKFVIVLSLFVLITACQKKQREGIDPSSDHKAPADIKESFKKNNTDESFTEVLKDGSLKIHNNFHLAINKNALNKEYLFSTNLMSQTPTPMFASLQSRVVSFILRDQSVYMLDVTKNHEVGANNIPQHLLLAEFPIIENKSDDSFVVVDFNSGMKQVFTLTGMAGSDDPTSPGFQFQLPVLKINISYVDEISVKTQSSLLIKQVVQADIIKNSNPEAVNYEVRYQLKPYLPHPDFEPVVSPGFEKVGYFEANPLVLKDGSTRIYAMKWNLKKPIQFAISANTPEKYRGLVKESLLYWNKILGEGAVQVIQLTDSSITAPDFDLNVIQWVDWDAAGYAFADAQVDPRSGEVTNAQIFFPSAFLEANVPKRLRLLQAAHQASQNSFLTLKGFKSSRLCARDLYADINNKMNLTQSNISNEAMEKATQDYVYEVIAHEMGHVLGLRHNFAGNLAANYDFKDRKKLILDYYANQKAPKGVISSSSVMEYSRFEESAWNGDRLRKNTGKALDYDQMAISHLYLKIELPDADQGRLPAFCTDSDIGRFADCNMGDAGRSIISASSGVYQFGLESLAAKLINFYISATKRSDESGLDLVSVDQVNINPKTVANSISLDLAKLMSLLKKDSHFIAVQNKFIPLAAWKNSEIEAAEKKYIENEFLRLGDLEGLVGQISTDFEDQLLNRVSELLQLDLYNSGTDQKGQKYQFTDLEKEQILKQVQALAPQIKSALILNEIKILSGDEFNFESTYGQSLSDDKRMWSENTVVDQLAVLNLSKLQNYVFSHSGEVIKSDLKTNDGKLIHIELPMYQYSEKIRLAASELFQTQAMDIAWAYNERQQVKDFTESELSLLGDNAEHLVFSKSDKLALQWYLLNKKIAENVGL